MSTKPGLQFSKCEAGSGKGSRVARQSTPRTQDRADTASADAAVSPVAPNEADVNFGPLNRYLGFYLRRLYEGYRRHFLTVASELDFGPREVAAIFVIGLNPGFTPSQLRSALAMDGAQITALLNLFERRGYVDRRVSSSDGRSRHVFLTPMGEALLEHLHEVVGWFDRSFAGDALTDGEMHLLIGLLAKLYAGANR